MTMVLYRMKRIFSSMKATKMPETARLFFPFRPLRNGSFSDIQGKLFKFPLDFSLLSDIMKESEESILQKEKWCLPMRVTLKDIVEKTGISKSVVSMYLNKDPRVRLTDEKKKRIDAAVKELGYRPSLAACALRKGRSRMLGLVLGGITDSFVCHAAEAYLHYAEKRGYQLLISLTSWNLAKERSCLESLIERQVDGILYAPYPLFDDAFQKKLEDIGIPMIHFGECFPYFLSVRRNLENAFRQLAASVLRNGGRNICACTYFTSDEFPLFQKMMEEAGVHVTSLCVDKINPEETAVRLLEERPECVYAGCQIIRALTNRIRRDGIDYCPDLFTNYHFPQDLVDDPCVKGVVFGNFYTRASVAVNMLIDRIESPENNAPAVRFIENVFYERNEFLEKKHQLVDTLEKAERMNL